MNEYPKSRQQKEFEQMADYMIEILADLTREQQKAITEYAFQLHEERDKPGFTNWKKERI